MISAKKELKEARRELLELKKKANALAQFFDDCAEITRKEGNIRLALIQERRAEEHRQNAKYYSDLLKQLS